MISTYGVEPVGRPLYVGRWSGVAYAQQAALQHSDSADQALWLGQGRQVADRFGDRGGRLVGQAQDHDAGVWLPGG